MPSPPITEDNPLLLPDYEEDPLDILVSFPDIKRKTTQTLYSSTTTGTTTSNGAAAPKTTDPWAIDKSPKGSVDEPIRPLVDLINHHPSFSTLSSCSGRIALFRPWENSLQTTTTTTTSSSSESIVTKGLAEEEGSSGREDFLNGEQVDNKDVTSEEKRKGTPGSGKGSGGWLLVSHEVIDHSALLSLFDSDSQEELHEEETTTVMMFKVEPMLLHIAAATLERGRQLLGLALEMGFRESGLVLPSKRNNRVTVAIRGVSLALTVPLTFQGPLRPSNDYLRALVDQANHRLKANESKLQRLCQNVKETLFRRPTTGGADSSQDFQYQCQALPDLNLWGHDAIVLPSSESNRDDGDIDVLVFGGYGQGPALAGKDGDGRQCRRVGEVHSLKRRRRRWDSHWETIPMHNSSSEIQEQTVRLEAIGVDVREVNFTPREGVASFSFQSRRPRNVQEHDPGANATRIVVVWGGRKGPNHPLNDLLLYEHPHIQGPFVTPVDARGNAPLPRWGHSLTPLELQNPTQSSDSTIRRLAILVGGRNERASLDSVHMLSLVSADSPGGSGHFLWETIIFPSNLPPPAFPFHHAAVAAPFDDEKYAVIVFGGQLDPCNLLSAFSASDPKERDFARHTVTSFTLPLDTESPCKAGECRLSIPANLEEDIRVGRAMACMDSFATTSENDSTSRDRFLCLCSGGVPASSSENDSHDLQTHRNSSCLQLFEMSRHCDDSDGETDWRVQNLNLSAVDSAKNQDLADSVMVHHRALAVPAPGSNQAEVLLLGGGVMGFAFGPCFSRSHCIQILPKRAAMAAGPTTTRRLPSTDGFARKDGMGVAGRDAAPTKAPVTTKVAYVSKHNAKVLKTELEKLDFLDKRFRMTPASRREKFDNGEEDDSIAAIAVPITEACLSVVVDTNGVDSSSSIIIIMNDEHHGLWLSLIEGVGTQEMPLSTSQFAKKKK